MAATEPGGGLLLSPNLDFSPAKRRLYEAALELFGRDGYHAVSIRDIANALGQQSSAIYFHVSSKQDLLYDLALIGHRSHFEALRDALMDAGSDPEEQLRAVMRAHVATHLDYPLMARLTNRELGSLQPEQREAVLAIRSQAEQITVDVIERGVRLKAFVCDDPFLAAKCIGAMGIRLPEWWTPEAPRTREQILDRYADYAVRLVT